MKTAENKITFSTVLAEFVRLDKEINDCEQCILIAERLNRQGHWNSKWDKELEELRSKLEKTKTARNELEIKISTVSSWNFFEIPVDSRQK